MTYSNSLYCIDFETTRDSAKELHIIEIGIVLLDEALFPCKEFNSLVRPPCKIDPIDARVTGLCDADLQSSEDCSSVFPQLLEFADEGTVLAHNAKYDKKVMEITCKRLGVPVPNWSYVDTLKLAKRYIDASSYSLSKLLSEIGISYKQHRALEDCKATASLFRYIVSKIKRTSNTDAVEIAFEIGSIEEPKQESLFGEY